MKTPSKLILEQNFDSLRARLIHVKSYLRNDWDSPFFGQDEYFSGDTSKEYIEFNWTDKFLKFSIRFDSSRPFMTDWCNPLHTDYSDKKRKFSCIGFDEEMYWPTIKGAHQLALMSERFNEFCNFDVHFSYEVDCDYPDNMYLIVRIPYKVNQSENRLFERLAETDTKINNFNSDVIKRINNQSSKLKTCPNCESKINVRFVSSVSCPACKSVDFGYTSTDKSRLETLKSLKKELSEKVKKISA